MSRSPLIAWSLALSAGILCSRLAPQAPSSPRESADPRLVRVVGEVLASEAIEPWADGLPRQRLWLQAERGEDRSAGDIIQVVTEAASHLPLPGARLAATGAWRTAPPLALSGRWAAWPQRPAAGFLKADGPLALLPLASPPAGPAAWLARARAALGRRIDQAISDERTAGLTRALLLGQRDGLAPDLGRDFQRTGLLHILAVSGQHVAIVVFLASLALRALGLSPRLRRLTLIPTAWIYVLLAGSAAPALRAGLMLTVYLLTADTRERGRGLEALALSVIIILCLDPQELFRVGFQLSVLATAGILCWSKPIASVWPSAGGPLARWIGQSTAVSLAAFLGAAPCLAWHFHQLTPYAPVLSVVAAPLVVLLIGGALLTAALGAYTPGILETAMGWGGAALEGLVRSGAEWPGASMPVETWAVCVVVGAAAWAAWRGGSGRWSAAALPLAWALLPWCGLFVGVGVGAGRPPVVLEALRVGHGCATLLRLEGRALLYDCGGQAGEPWRIGQQVASELIARGWPRLDVLVLSHADADHINGVQELSRRISIDRVIVPEGLADVPAGRSLLRLLAERGAQAHVQFAPRLSIIESDGLGLWSLLPAGPEARGRNDGSLALLLEARGRRAILSGDLEDLGSRLLAQEFADRPCDLLLLPHHGRATSATIELARALRPREAWASCGRPDRSTRSTLHIFGLFGARTRTTWEDGDLRWTACEPY